MIRNITLAEYFWLAEQVTGIGTKTLSAPPESTSPTRRSNRRNQLRWRGVLPRLFDKAAVLTTHLA